MAEPTFQPGDILYFGDDPEFERQFAPVAPRCRYCGYVLVISIDTPHEPDPLYSVHAMYNVPRRKGHGYGYDGRMFYRRVSILAERHAQNPDMTVLANVKGTFTD